MSQSSPKGSQSPQRSPRLLGDAAKFQPALSPKSNETETPTSPSQSLALATQPNPDLSPASDAQKSPALSRESNAEELVTPVPRSRWNSLAFWQSKDLTGNLESHAGETLGPGALIEGPVAEPVVSATIEESVIWSIPNRLSGLFVRTSPDQTTTATVIQDKFVPNTISSIKTASQIINVTTINGRQSEQAQSQEQSNGRAEHGGEDDDRVADTSLVNYWFTPWRWTRNNNPYTVGSASNMDTADSNALTLEDDENKLFRKLVANSIQCLSYGIEKPVSWSMFKLHGDKVGEVKITGNKSCKRGVLMKKLPKSNFEVQEDTMNVAPASKDDASASSIDSTGANGHNGFNGSTNGGGNADDIIIDESVITESDAVVLPDLKWNYRPLTLLTRTRILSSKFCKFAKGESHLYTLRKSAKKRISKRVCVISIHGFLPQKFTKNLSNESSGSSSLMLEYTNKELKLWSLLNNADMKIDNIMLEGYGKIFERLNDHLSILESWYEEIEQSDYILMVASSNSVALAIHLMAKLITANAVSFENKKLGLIGISGLTLGPIASLEGKILSRGGSNQENEMISEMFDLEDPESMQSKELCRSFETIIKSNCKVTFGASLLDCISPLYSSLSLQFGHPNIFRMVYIDSGIGTMPDFVVSLLNIILGLKNLNYSDHGLLVEMSKFFEGKLGTGKHSSILRDKHVYRMGISNLLDTNDLRTAQPLQIWPRAIKEMNTNPYHIPWCLRGVLEELANVRGNWEVDDMLDQLIEEFHSWEGEGTPWNELKKCMEAFGAVRNVDIGL